MECGLTTCHSLLMMKDPRLNQMATDFVSLLQSCCVHDEVAVVVDKNLVLHLVLELALRMEALLFFSLGH